MSRSATRIAALAVLAVALFAFAGCGSDDGSGSDSGSASTAGTTASTGTASAAGGTASTATGATGAGSGTGSPKVDAATDAVAGGNPTVDDVITVIGSVLQQQGLDRSVSQCVADALRKSLTPGDVKNIHGAAPPPAFQQKIAAAAQGCNTAKGQ